MKNTALKLVFWINYILLILYICWRRKEGQMSIQSSIPLFISSLMLIDITYISSCNVRENKVIWLFCGLLALDSWYVLLSFEEDIIENLLFIILSPVIWYVSIKFILMFLFQGSGYKFGKIVNLILLVTCIISLVGVGISSRVYACVYGIQFLVNWFCFLFIIIYHYKRIIFVLKNEWKSILFSMATITITFFVYYFATIEVQGHISNFGIYLPVLLFFLSVHGILLKEHSSFPLSTVFSRMQTVLIICVSLFIFGLIFIFTGNSYEDLFIMVNMLFAFLYICNIVLGHSLKQGRSKIIKDSKYNTALKQLQQEEELKTEFANFLHDDVLQDLLSIKNMMTKVHHPDIQDIIIETLDSLNTHIREQMQDYHPVILKNLTIKQNYQNLLEAISESFSQRDIVVSFDCPDTVFLVEPYNMMIYRLLKELLTNVYKHSDGSRAWVTLTQKKNVIKLCVSDNGTANAGCLTSVDKSKHKGLISIVEQIDHIGGTMNITDNIPHGICIQIRVPMKGDVSYQYFVS